MLRPRGSSSVDLGCLPHAVVLVGRANLYELVPLMPLETVIERKVCSTLVLSQHIVLRNGSGIARSWFIRISEGFLVHNSVDKAYARHISPAPNGEWRPRPRDMPCVQS